MLGTFFVFAAAFLWGLIGPVAKFAFVHGVPPLEVAFYRAALGALLFGLHCLVRGSVRVAWRDYPALVGFGLFGVSVFFLAYQVCVNEGGAALASILLYTAPAWVALYSFTLGGEAVTRTKLAALVTAMAGAVFVSIGASGTGGGVSTLAVAAGLISGMAYALHYVVTSRLLQRYSAATIYLHSMAVGTLGLLPFVSLGPRGLVPWLVFLTLATACTYGAYLCYCLGMARLAPTRVAVTANLEPVLAALLAYLLWGETFSPLGYLGGALVVTAVFMMVLAARPAERSAARGGRAACTRGETEGTDSS